MNDSVVNAPERPVDRESRLLHRIPKSHKVLEIGPGYNPLIRRADGWNVHTLDHGTAEELRQKYRAIGTDVSRIDEIDFVWRGGPMESAIPVAHHGTFDGCLASHVIEHVPDLIGFFGSIAKLLRPGGILSLAVPDKRYCFDYFHQISVTGDAIEAHHEKRTRHSRKSIFNHSALFALSDGEAAWGQQPVGSLDLPIQPFETSKAAFDNHNPSPDAPYVDCHAWYFTPSSFELLAIELSHLKLIDFKFEEIFPAAGCEFVVCLSKGAGKPLTENELKERRLLLMKRCMMEQKEQIDYLLSSKNSMPESLLMASLGASGPRETANGELEGIDLVRRERDDALRALEQAMQSLANIKSSRLLKVGGQIRGLLGRPPY